MGKQQALLIQPGGPELTTVVELDPTEGYGIHVGGSIETWPSPMTKDIIIGSNDRKYRLKFYVNDESVIRKLPYNGCASITADPIAEIKGHSMYGPVLVISIDKKHRNLDLKDWNAICKGVWCDDDEKNAALVEKNARSKFRQIE